MSDYQETIFSVDTEFSGQGPGNHSLLSIGAVVVGDHDKTFYIELRPLPEEVAPNPQAMEVNKLDWEGLKTKGTPPQEAMDKFFWWVGHVRTGRPVFASFGTCDWLWVDYYAQRFMHRNPFGANSMDIKSWWMGRMRCDWQHTTKRLIPKELQWGRKHTHNALQDAIEQATLFENMRAYQS